MPNPTASEESFEKAFRRALGEPDLPPVPAGQVRPLTDPVALERWFAAHESVEPKWDYNPFSRYHMNK
jgi:hypothetical protein